MAVTSPAKKLLLIGWDAADWKVINPLLDRGQMPHLARLVAEGASGNLATIEPPLSPMLWTSIATGKRPGKHGIHGFVDVLTERIYGNPLTEVVEEYLETFPAFQFIIDYNTTDHGTGM